mgnify:CR=1 FL=1
MSKQRDRDEFIALMAKEGVSTDDARKLLRYAATLHRLAELECNGDHGTVPRIAVQEDRTRRRVEALCATLPIKHVVHSGDRVVGVFDDAETATKWIDQAPRDALFSTYRLATQGVIPIFQGDPRGAVLKLQAPSGKTNDWGKVGICVPA